MMKIAVKRGDVVDVDLRGAEGKEKMNHVKAGCRPCVVVQNDVGNQNSPLTIVVPLNDSRQWKNLPVQVAVYAGHLHIDENKDSVIECGQVRTVDGDARILRHRGYVDEEVMVAVDYALAVSVGLARL